MPSIALALTRALNDAAHRRVLAMLVVPMTGAIALWALLGWFYWDAWTGFFGAWMRETRIAQWVIDRGAQWVVHSVAVIMVVALLVPAVLVTATLITAVALIPALVSVAERTYPGLEKRAGLTFVGGLGNALAAFGWFALLWLITLPLWLTGFAGIVLPAVHSAYLSQRLFPYDALAEHASREEYRLIVERTRVQLYALGLVLAPLYYIPFVNLVAPVFSALAYTHFCLDELAHLRRAGGRTQRSAASRGG
jgi:CysZ protein